ncbi:MAG TPA: diguanylate cyclase, partial [Steroidobacteraceae bacterium]
MNQLAFAVGALAGLVCAAIAFALLWRLRLRRPASPYDAQHLAVFEQWPTTGIALEPATMRCVSGNPAALRNLGYTLDQLRGLKFADIFSVEGVEGRGALLRLQEATSRAPLEMRQRCADGSELNVEATCERILVDGRQLLAVAVHDVTIRRKVETQLLEKHQQLDHLAHHDHLTGLPNRLYLAAHLPGAIEEAKKNGTVLAVLFLDLDRFK